MDKNEHTMGPGTLACTTAPDAIDTVCIHKDRFAELVRAEMEREILFHAYQLMDKYGVESVMDAIFNPKFKYGEKDNAE